MNGSSKSKPASGDIIRRVLTSEAPAYRFEQDDGMPALRLSMLLLADRLAVPEADGNSRLRSDRFAICVIQHGVHNERCIEQVIRFLIDAQRQSSGLFVRSNNDRFG